MLPLYKNKVRYRKFPGSHVCSYLPFILKHESRNCVKVSIFEVILVRIFPHSDLIRRDTPYLSVFSPNAGK